jgi:hypothetical protein
VSNENEPKRTKLLKFVFEQISTFNLPDELKGVIWDFVTTVSYIFGVYMIDKYILESLFREEPLSLIPWLTLRILELTFLLKVLSTFIKELEKLSKEVASLRFVQSIFGFLKNTLDKVNTLKKSSDFKGK